MSMWTSVTITFPNREEVAALESMVALWNASVDREHGLEIGESLHEERVYLGGRALGFDSDFGLDDEGAHLAYHDKYETEGLATFGEAFTHRYPTATVLIETEWTGEEPSVTREQWQGGRIVAERTSAGNLEPVYEPGHSPAEVLDRLRAELRELAELLGRIEVGEDFFEHFTRREAEALATVYDTADMAEIAGEIRRKCAEADPEAWAEEVDAVTS